MAQMTATHHGAITDLQNALAAIQLTLTTLNLPLSTEEDYYDARTGILGDLAFARSNFGAVE